MRVERIDLFAFGPFTNGRLDFHHTFIRYEEN